MKRKQGSDHQAAPAKSRGALEQKKKKDSIRCVQQDIYVVMSNGVQTEEFVVKSVREPCQRMPVFVVIGGKGPFYGRPRQARSHLSVLCNVGIVVVADEPIPGYR